MTAPARDAGLLPVWPPLMEPHRGTTYPGHLRTAALLLVALSLLALPVSYTGGRDLAHPHALMQLIVDVAHGHPNHHAPVLDHRQHASRRTTARLASPPDGAAVVSLPGGLVDRMSLVGMAIGFSFFAIFIGLLPPRPENRRLFGARHAPPTPPPR